MNNNKLANRIRKLAGITLATLVLSACSSGGDGAAVNPTLTVSNVAVAEGNSGTSNLVFTLTLSSAAGNNASVAYATSDISATAGSDYTAQSGTASFTAGALSTTISIPVAGDTDIEDDETLLLTLSTPSGVTMAATTITATGTISNDDNGGYFTGSVTLTSPATTYSDLQAIFNNDEFVIASVANDLLYKGNITSRTGIDYTASVSIYKTGVYVRSAAVTGQFTSGSGVTGTLSGTDDYTNGTFTLTYSALNSRAPLVFADGDIWGDNPVTAVVNFTSTTVANIDLRNSATSFNLASCDVAGATRNTVNSEQPGRIQSFSGVLTACANVDDGATAQGYITSFDLNGTDNALLFVLFNDNDTQISILDCVNGVCP